MWDSDLGSTSEDANQLERHHLEWIADSAVAGLWDTAAHRGEPFPVFDWSDRFFAYGVRYATRVSRFPDSEEYLRTIRSVRDTRLRLQAGEDVPGTSESAESVFDRFACVYVAATRRDFPVLAIQKSPPVIDVIGDIALRRAQEYFDAEDVSFHRLYFLGPHQEYFGFRSGEAELLVSACNLEPQEPEEILVPNATRMHPPEIVERIDAAWSAALELEAIPGDEVAVEHTKTDITHKELVPKINYSYWCVPTSFAMALSFWDNLVNGKTIAGYGCIVDHWLRHPTDPPTNRFGENVPNIIDEYMDPSTGTWRKGGTFTDQLKKASGVTFAQKDYQSASSNNYGWDPLRTEIDAGRPCLWSITGAHTMTAVGYETKKGQKYVIVYNPPNSSTPTFEASYEIDQWGGVANTNTGVGTIYPSSAGAPDHLVIISPDGGEDITVSAATEVWWFVSGSGITSTKLLLSTDQGRTWQTAANGLATKPGWNTYDWVPTKPSTTARLKLEGYSATNALVAADGSFEDFAMHKDKLNSWSGWRDLGNPVASTDRPVIGVLSIAAARNADGRLELFASTGLGGIWHRYQQAANASTWIGWSDMGHLPGVSLNPVEAAVNSDGRMEIFAVGSDGAVWHRWQSKPSAGPWSGWTSLGAPAGAALPVAVKACANKDGRIELFVLGSDGTIWHGWQSKPSAGPWSSWNSLGKPSAVELRSYAVHLDSAGMIELCAVGSAPGEGEFGITKSSVWHTRQPEPNHTSAWQGWTSLGTPCAPDAYLSVELGTEKDGRLALYAAGEGRLWRRTQTSPAALSWTNWNGMGRPTGQTALLSHLAADHHGDGRQDVFAIGARGYGPSTVFRCWHRWQTAANGGWNSWAGLGSPSGMSPETLTIASQADQRLAFFAVTSEDRSVWVLAEES